MPLAAPPGPLWTADAKEPHPIERTVILYFGSYAERTAEGRKRVEGTCERTGVGFVEQELDVDNPATNWRAIQRAVGEAVEGCDRVLVDISTMPREIIWYVLWAVGQGRHSVGYVYHAPENYGDGWLSRDPRTPRLVYKMSGMALPSKRTALVVTAGFDLQRAIRLIYWCEPSRVLVGLQGASGFLRNQSAMEIYREKLRKEHECRFFELDAYGEDRGLGVIEEEVARLGKSWNVIMSSLGPKLTAISLYRLQRGNPELGLVYAPSTQFSETYSYGIGSAFGGELADEPR